MLWRLLVGVAALLLVGIPVLCLWLLVEPQIYEMKAEDETGSGDRHSWTGRDVITSDSPREI